MKIIITSLIIFITILATPLFGDSVGISQIDTTDLLLNQNIKLYLNVANKLGLPIGSLTKSNFKIYESPDGKSYEQIDSIIDFKSYANRDAGINFLLLIDNSGSMYLNMKGRRTRNSKDTRIKYARDAVVSFLRSMTNTKDRVGLVSYNTYYRSFSAPVSNRKKIENYLSSINMPSIEEGYTETYASLALGVNEFKSIKGRKVMIILTDGINDPYFEPGKRIHKDFGKKVYTYSESIKSCQKMGVSVFAINFGERGSTKDRNIYKIANETGGAVFEAHNQKQLENMYERIVEQILGEYLITYRATMKPSDKKFVKVLCKTERSEMSSVRYYFSSTIFGLPIKEFTPMLFIPLLLAFFLIWLLSLVKFEYTTDDHSVGVLSIETAKSSIELFTFNKKVKKIESYDNLLKGLPKEIETHSKKVLKKIGLPKNKKNYKKIVDLWLKKRAIFDKTIEKSDFKKENIFSRDNENGCVAMTLSGSLITLGPLKDGGRSVLFADIDLSTNKSDVKSEDNCILDSDVVLREKLVFKKGPVKETSKIMEIGVARDFNNINEQEKSISDVNESILNQFISINNDLVSEKYGQSDLTNRNDLFEKWIILLWFRIGNMSEYIFYARSKLVWEELFAKFYDYLTYKINSSKERDKVFLELTNEKFGQFIDVYKWTESEKKDFDIGLINALEDIPELDIYGKFSDDYFDEAKKIYG